MGTGDEGHEVSNGLYKLEVYNIIISCVKFSGELNVRDNGCIASKVDLCK